MVLWQYFVLLVVLSHNLKQYGDRLINMVYPELPLLIRWTGQVQIFSAWFSRFKEKLGANPVPVQIPIGAEENFKGIY